MPTIDAISQGTQAALGTCTWSHTVGVESNMVLYAFVGNKAGAGNNPETTGVTYNSVAMTKISLAQVTLSLGSGTREGSWWYLKNPSQGANNLVATSGSTLDNWVCAAISLYGVDLTTIFRTPQTSTAAGGVSTTTTTTGGASTDINLSGLCYRAIDEATTGAGQTIQEFIDFAAFAHAIAGMMTTQPGGASVTDSFSWTTTTSGDGGVEISFAVPHMTQGLLPILEVM